jgi:hypothetical protein
MVLSLREIAIQVLEGKIIIVCTSPDVCLTSALPQESPLLYG